MSNKVELCEKVINLGLNEEFTCDEIEFCEDCPFNGCFNGCCNKFISEKILDVANEVIRKNKCKYCEDEDNDEYIQIYKDSDGVHMLSIETTHWDESCDNYDTVSIQIDYCPFCGKKLV